MLERGSRLNTNGSNDGPIKDRQEDGGVEMRVTLEINLALWGMIFCAAVQAAQHFEVY